MRTSPLFVLFLFIFSGISNAFAFPEMIRHGYVNCTACHVSPTGGGLLNEYGRELSKETLSTWISKSESNREHSFAYGLADPPSWLTMGGDVRSVYIYKDDVFATQGRTILMQAELEGAAKQGRWSAVATLGYQNPTFAQGWKDHIALRRHYLLYQFSDETSFRVGKYIPPFGINTPDHVNLTRRGIGLGQGFESYNLEYSWLGPLFSLHGAVILGRPDNQSLNRESGASLLSGIALGERSKLGLSYLYGANNTYQRHLFGPYGLIGFSERMTLLTEIDFQSKTLKTIDSSVFGVFTTHKLSYEVAKGLWAFVQQEWGKVDLSAPAETETYGLGVQFFPRPHFEFNLSFERQQMTSISPSFFNYAWLMSHFYF